MTGTAVKAAVSPEAGAGVAGGGVARFMGLASISRRRNGSGEPSVAAEYSAGTLPAKAAFPAAVSAAVSTGEGEFFRDPRNEGARRRRLPVFGGG